ncbi:MAG TPA: amidohydrolase family protein [Pirellulaceae bacterium]|jgi:L-fuconolactonase
MRLNRRQFLSQSSAAATASLVAAAVFPTAIAQGQSAVNSEIPIIDCHQHLWDRSKFTLPWIKAGSLLDRSYVMSDYLAAIEGTGIKNSIYMEVDVEPSQQQAEAEHLIEICKSKTAPTIAAVVSGRPASESFVAYVKQFKDSPYIKGIRQVLHGGGTPAGYCLQDSFLRGIRSLGELNLSFDLCLRPQELTDGAALAEKCPNTKFILDHCGNADPEAFLNPGDSRLTDAKPGHTADEWRRGLDRVASAKNVICKISGIVARVPKMWSAEDLAPIVNHCLDAFGPQRVIFGSDWPVCLNGAPLRDWVAALKQIIASRPANEQRLLLRDNAIRFYRLVE